MRRILTLALSATLSALVHCGPMDGGSRRTSSRADDSPASAPAQGSPVASSESQAPSSADAPPSPPSPSPSADAGPPPPSFLVGYNEAWFGPHYGTDLTSDFDLVAVGATFDGIRAAGGHVVRLWLFEALQGITLGMTSPRITSLDPSLLNHLEQVLLAARARSLSVYLTALDGNAMPQDAGPARDLYWNMLNDAYGEAPAYEAKVLSPLLATLSNYQDVLYGFDLVNEIEAPRIHGYWLDPFNGPRAYMMRTATFVKGLAPWLRVTSSAGYDTASIDIATGLFTGLGLDFYDLHVYSDLGVIPAMANVCSKAKADGVPILLGEFGQRTQVDSDLLQETSTRAFLTAAKGACFAGALPWRYDAVESWWAFKRGDGTDRPAVSVMKSFSGP